MFHFKVYYGIFFMLEFSWRKKSTFFRLLASSAVPTAKKQHFKRYLTFKKIQLKSKVKIAPPSLTRMSIEYPSVSRRYFKKVIKYLRNRSTQPSNVTDRFSCVSKYHKEYTLKHFGSEIKLIAHWPKNQRFYDRPQKISWIEWATWSNQECKVPISLHFYIISMSSIDIQDWFFNGHFNGQNHL